MRIGYPCSASIAIRNSVRASSSICTRSWASGLWANLLTSQVHVAYDRTRVRLEDIRAAVESLQQAAVPGEDRPRHPLDPDPLRDGITRVIGAVSGLGLITFLRLIAPQIVPVPVLGAAAGMAGIFNLIQGFPRIRDGLRRSLGRRPADVIMVGGSIAALSAANSPLGLVVSALEGFFLAEEVSARRSSYRRYEDSIDTAVSALPGAVIRLEAGTRVPRNARVIEGFGTAVESGGQQHPVGPESRVDGGTLVLGGPFVLELEGAEPAPVQPRPVPRAATPFESYQRVAVPAALGVAVLQVLRTGSFTRAFEALLLLNPRPAVMGTEMAHLMAAARALRAGMTVVGTRPDRSVALPDAVLLDGARLLTDGVEVSEVVPLQPGMDSDRVLKLAAMLSHACGEPWGPAFAETDQGPASDGSFDGRTAVGRVGGTVYQLRQLTQAVQLHPALIGPWLSRREVLLELRTEAGEGPLGLITVRPKVAEDVAVLTQNLPGPSRRAGRAVTWGPDRGGPALQAGRSYAARHQCGDRNSGAPAERKDRCHHLGRAQPEPAFAACDLAIGMSRGHSGLFPARADLLAPDLLRHCRLAGSRLATDQSGSRRLAFSRLVPMWSAWPSASVDQWDW